MKSFINSHPLEKMDEFKEPYELMLYTKNIIDELLNDIEDESIIRDLIYNLKKILLKILWKMKQVAMFKN